MMAAMCQLTEMRLVEQWRRNHGCARCWHTEGSYSGILERSGPKLKAAASPS